ncbi:ceramidase, partial [Chytridium lagenaria]
MARHTGEGLAPSGVDGYWGNITATIDWCETNHAVSHYVAEYWNTLSSVLYMILTVVGLFSSRVVSAEPRYWIGLLFFGMVGAGSALFHGTLLFEMQMLDEVPMIFCASILVHNMILLFPGMERFQYPVKALMSFYAAAVLYSHVQLPDPAFFQLTYSALKSSTRGLWRLYFFSVSTYVLGTTLWIKEHHVCEDLREWREQVGYPLRVVSELHAWWHILTGVGTYALNIFCLRCRSALLKVTDHELVW